MSLSKPTKLGLPKHKLHLHTNTGSSSNSTTQLWITEPIAFEFDGTPKFDSTCKTNILCTFKQNAVLPLDLLVELDEFQCKPVDKLIEFLVQCPQVQFIWFTSHGERLRIDREAVTDQPISTTKAQLNAVLANLDHTHYELLQTAVSQMPETQLKQDTYSDYIAKLKLIKRTLETANRLATTQHFQQLSKSANQQTDNKE